MPDVSRFFDGPDMSRNEAFYAVQSHEIIHWTGASHRLDRNLEHRFGDEQYVMEELIAELGSAYLCALLGLSPEPRPDHAAYIANWLTVLRKDKGNICCCG